MEIVVALPCFFSSMVAMLLPVGPSRLGPTRRDRQVVPKRQLPQLVQHRGSFLAYFQR